MTNTLLYLFDTLKLAKVRLSSLKLTSTRPRRRTISILYDSLPSLPIFPFHIPNRLAFHLSPTTTAVVGKGYLTTYLDTYLFTKVEASYRKQVLVLVSG